MISNWPPPYTIRRSAKAKRASIRVSLYQEIEVVLPQSRFAPDPLALLNEHKAWILKQLAAGKPIPQREERIYPPQVEFPGLDHCVQVSYQSKASSRLTLRQNFDQILLTGPIEDWPRVQVKLLTWLNQHAEVLLHPQVMTLGLQHGFTIESLSVKFMKTRWGSCNREGKLSLNSQLVFLPLELIHHVILHELCHRKYLSHGPRFWGLLKKLDPQMEANNQALKQVQKHLPSWLIGA